MAITRRSHWLQTSPLCEAFRDLSTAVGRVHGCSCCPVWELRNKSSCNAGTAAGRRQWGPLDGQLAAVARMARPAGAAAIAAAVTHARRGHWNSVSGGCCCARFQCKGVCTGLCSSGKHGRQQQRGRRPPDAGSGGARPRLPGGRPSQRVHDCKRRSGSGCCSTRPAAGAGADSVWGCKTTSAKICVWFKFSFRVAPTR